MDCIHFQSKVTKKMKEKTLLGYDQYRYRDCGKQYNDKSGTKLNFIEHPTEIVVFCKCTNDMIIPVVFQQYDIGVVAF